MAVDDEPPATQPASPRPATSREIIQIAGAAIALVAVIIAGMSLVVSMTLAPMREHIRLLRADMRLLRAEINDLRQDMHAGFRAVDDEFQEVREDLAGIRERLTRVEVLLERHAGQSDTPPSPRQE